MNENEKLTAVEEKTAADKSHDEERSRQSQEAEKRRLNLVKKRKRKKIIKWIVLTILLLAIAAGIAYGVYQLFFKPEPKPEDVTTFSYRGPFSSSIMGYGQVKSSKNASVSIGARGELLELNVSEGDTVFEGDLLFVVDDASLIDEIAAAEKELVAIEEQQADSIASREKTVKEKKEKTVELDEIYEKLNALNVTTPFAGRLMNVKVSADEYVAEGQELATLVDDSKMVLRQYFSYAFENDITVGKTAEVSIPSSMAVLTGKVTKIDKVRRVTTEGAILFAVEITLDNPGTLTADMAATAILVGSDGREITPYESGRLNYVLTKLITSPARGRIIEYKMLDYSDYGKGEMLVHLSDDGYNEQIEAMKNNTKIYDEQIANYDKQIADYDEQIKKKQESIYNLNQQFDSFNAKAPMSGTVMSVLVQPGTMIEANTAVVTIADTSSMTVDIQLDERNVSEVTIGSMVDLVQETGMGEMSYFGTVTSISLQGNYDYGYTYFPATVTIQGGDGLRSGSTMRYNIMLNSKDDCVLVPINAVKYTEEGTCVFVKPAEGEDIPESTLNLAKGVVPDGYYAVLVETGLSDDSQIEIISGISEGVELFVQEGINADNMGMYY